MVCATIASREGCEESGCGEVVVGETVWMSLLISVV